MVAIPVSPSKGTRASGRPRRHLTWSLRIGIGVIVLFVASAILSTIWTPYPPMATNTGPAYAPPSAEHWFGTDRVGADVFSRTLAATGTDVAITVIVVVCALAVGAVWGSLAGFFGGWFDRVTMRLLEVLQAFPSLLFAMLAVAIAGSGIANVIVVVAILPLPDYVRLARAEIMTKKHWQFAEAAVMVGNRWPGVLFRHLLPNSVRPLLAFASINASWVTGSVAALGYLGLGIEPGSAEWGSMISRGQDSIVSGEWWISFFPGVATVLLSVAFHLVGDGVSDLDRKDLA